jgi:hypothetical protein
MNAAAARLVRRFVRLVHGFVRLVNRFVYRQE